MVSEKSNTRTVGELVVKVKSAIRINKEFDDIGMESIPIIKLKNIQDGVINIDAIERVNLHKTEQLEKHLISANDLIINIVGSNFKTVVADKSIEGYLFGSNFIALTLSDEIKPEIIAKYLNSSVGQKELQDRASGTTMSKISIKSLMEVPL